MSDPNPAQPFFLIIADYGGPAMKRSAVASPSRRPSPARASSPMAARSEPGEGVQMADAEPPDDAPGKPTALTGIDQVTLDQVVRIVLEDPEIR